jgi:dethiobiotin synthetase
VDTGADAREAADSEVLSVAAGFDSPHLASLLRLPERILTSLASSGRARATDPAMVFERLAALRAQGLTLVIEDAGGLLLPLARGLTALDLASSAGLEVVLVTSTGLGEAGHVLLAARALADKKVPLRAVVVNGLDTPLPPADKTNIEALRLLVKPAQLVTLPRHAASTPLAAARASASALLPLIPPS